MSICKLGHRFIIFWSVIMGVSVINRKSAMSNPFSLCSSVAHCSSLSLKTTFEQTEESDNAFSCQTFFAPKSGQSITARFFNTAMVSALKQPCIPPVASHTKSGMKWLATKADFSLSTMATAFVGYQPQFRMHPTHIVSRLFYPMSCH